MYWTHKLPLKILLRTKRWKRKPRASAWNNKAFVTSCRTSGVRKMAQCAPPPGTSTVFLRPQWLQHKLKSSQKVSKYPRLERERPCPSRCANEELHLHQCVGGYSSGATYSRWFCRCTCRNPFFANVGGRSGVHQSSSTRLIRRLRRLAPSSQGGSCWPRPWKPELARHVPIVPCKPMECKLFSFQPTEIMKCFSSA